MHLRRATVADALADSEGDVIGQITVLAAARAPHPVEDASLAHLSNLFVRRDHWGAGLAGDPFDDPVPGLTMVEYRYRL